MNACCLVLVLTPLQTEEIPLQAQAGERLDVKISAEEAGEAFPYEWPLLE
jgi:hypothetical protein